MNRFVIEVDDLDIVASQLREAGVTLRSDLISILADARCWPKIR
ncbi:MAG: hypothetical protein R2845_13325 [Thermomicrobiales bacterium]